MDTFNQYFQNYSTADDTTDIVESVLSGGAGKVAALAIISKMNQIGRNMKGPDGKAISSQLMLLAGLIVLALNTVSEPPSGRR
jgi:hypothetical protein